MFPPVRLKQKKRSKYLELLVVGEGGIGKTTFIVRFLEDEFRDDVSFVYFSISHFSFLAWYLLWGLFLIYFV